MKPQTIKRFLVMSVLFNFLFVGALSNREALYMNGGKMPVLGYSVENPNTHFSYQDKDEVERWYLTDIIKWGKEGKYVWSIGDFLTILSLIFISFYGIYFGIQERKEWLEEKRGKNGERGKKMSNS